MSVLDMSQWLDSPGWMQDAECHLERGCPGPLTLTRSSHTRSTPWATVCARCPVLDECRDYAAENTDLWGFGAGQTRPGTINRPGQERARPNDTDLILATQAALALDEEPGDISKAETVNDFDELDELDHADDPCDRDDRDELGNRMIAVASEMSVSWVPDASVTTAEVPGGVSGWVQLATTETVTDQAPISVGSLVGLAGQLNEAMAVYEHAVRVDGIGAASTTGARVGFLVAVEHLYRYAKAAANATNNVGASETAESWGAA